MNKNITPLNEKNQRHGYWEYYYADGSLMFKSYYINDRLNGYIETYYKTNRELRFIELSFHL